jgi:hypothetical protein
MEPAISGIGFFADSAPQRRHLRADISKQRARTPITAADDPAFD